MRTIAMLAATTAAFLLAGCGSAAEEAVRQTLIDPDSAKFRNVRTCSANSGIVRGEVNGKNRMGAYTGFEPFFVEGEQVHFVASTEFVDVMNRCYGEDAAADDAMEDEAASSTVDDGAWSTSTDTNPVDDTKTVTADLTASEGRSSYGEDVRLVVRCQSNRTEMYAIWNDYLGDDSRSVYDEWKRVTVRVGSEPATEERWGISTDSQATFAPGSPIGLLKRMVEADRLVLQTTPYNESPVTAIFELEGMRAAVTPIAEECGWSL